MNVHNQRNDQATATAITNNCSDSDYTISITKKTTHNTSFCSPLNEQSPIPTITPTVMRMAQFLIFNLNGIFTIWSPQTIKCCFPQYINHKQVLKKIHKCYSQHILFLIHLTQQLQVLLIIMLILKYSLIGHIIIIIN